jgi:hypothetical protein
MDRIERGEDFFLIFVVSCTAAGLLLWLLLPLIRRLMASRERPG